MHLVEALVYGLAGGKKPRKESGIGDFPDMPLDLPPPPSAVPLRDGPRFSPSELARAVGPGVQIIGGQGTPPPNLSPPPIFDPEELVRRNQQILIDRAKRRAGIG